MINQTINGYQIKQLAKSQHENINAAQVITPIGKKQVFPSYNQAFNFIVAHCIKQTKLKRLKLIN